MKNAEYTKQLGTPTLGIVLANIAHRKRFVKSENSYHALYVPILRESIMDGSGRGGIAASLASSDHWDNHIMLK